MSWQRGALHLESPNVRFVIGVGVANKLGEIGYEPIPIKLLYEEIVTGAQAFSYEKITQSLPTLFRVDRYIPFFKFVAYSGIPYSELDDRVKRRLNVSSDDFITMTNKRKIHKIRAKCNSIEDLIELYEDIDKVIDYIPLLGQDKISQETLREFIVENLEILEYKSRLTYSNFRRLIRYYDWLVYADKIETS